MQNQSRFEIEVLVDRYLDSMSNDEELVMSEGSYSAKELRDHFKRGTTVGVRLAQMVLDDANAAGDSWAAKWCASPAFSGVKIEK